MANSVCDLPALKFYYLKLNELLHFVSVHDD